MNAVINCYLCLFSDAENKINHFHQPTVTNLLRVSIPVGYQRLFEQIKIKKSMYEQLILVG